MTWDAMKGVLRWILAIGFILAGANHFRTPAVYLAMMPPLLPDKPLLNVIAGVAEMLGGIGLLLPATRRLAAWGLILLLVAVFPANIYVALRGHMEGTTFSPTVLWLRLPFQALFVALVAWLGLK